jgi:hypothetical protein
MATDARRKVNRRAYGNQRGRETYSRPTGESSAATGFKPLSVLRFLADLTFFCRPPDIR